MGWHAWRGEADERCIAEEEPPDIVVYAEPGVYKVIAHVWVERAVVWGLCVCLALLGPGGTLGGRAEQQCGHNLAEVRDVELWGLLAVPGACEG